MPLPYEEIVGRIERGVVAPAYLLGGPDDLQQREIMDALRAAVLPPGSAGFAEIHLDGAAVRPPQVVGALRSRTLVKGQMVVVDEPSWVLPPKRGTDDPDPGPRKGRAPDEEAGLLQYLERPAAGTVLVLRASQEPDRRRKLVKRMAEAGWVVATVPPRPTEATAWLRARAQAVGLELDAAQAQIVASRSGGSCAQMSSELAKLRAYAGPGGRIDREALDALVPPGTEERVFDLLDAAAVGRGAEALRLGSALHTQGEPTVLLLFLLAKHLRLLIRALALPRGTSGAAAALGVHPYVAGKAIDQARQWSEDDLVAALELVWEADLGLKTGAMDDHSALEAALVGIAGARRHQGNAPGQRMHARAGRI